ncbi:MAG: hypothetical protein J6Y33_03170 [Prevotella sp.]|nr:hypothetical protein [Prevotella sp.]
MAKKDKFAQMKSQGGGALGSFENLVEQASTVAAIEKQAAVQSEQHTPAQQQSPATQNPYAAPRFMRLPNPQIPLAEYNLVSQYCNSFANMTRQDFVEMAIIEKLHNDGQMADEDFAARRSEILNRPPRGQRKGTKTQTSR